MVEWEKVLYKEQPVSDNYTDATLFLRDLKRNAHVRIVSLPHALLGASRVTTWLSVVTNFVAVYFMLKDAVVSTVRLMAVNSLIVISCYLWQRYVFTNENVAPWASVARSSFTYALIGYVVCPVLRTLTDSISTDTIYAMAVILFVAHLVFQDYGVGASEASKPVSLNTSICGAICLASRLMTAQDTFVLLTLAVFYFVLFPFFYQSSNYSPIISLFCFLSSLSVTYSVSTVMTLFFGLIIVLVNVICPVLFVYAQSFKENIHGPWDEAMIQEVK